MSDYLLGEVNRNPLSRGVEGHSLKSSLGQSLGAAYNDPTLGIGSLLEQQESLPPKNQGTLLSPDTLNEKYKGLGIEFSQPVSAEYAAGLADIKLQEKIRQDTIARGPQSFMSSALQLGAGLAGAAKDPFNLAASFFPIVGQARWAALGAKYGTTGGRLVGGAIEGVVGNAALEPFVYGLSSRQQLDYTMMDSLANVAFGGVLGGGLHAGFGKMGDYLKSLGPTANDVTSRYVVNELLNGRNPDVASLHTMMGAKLDQFGMPIELSRVLSDNDAINVKNIQSIEDLDLATREILNTIFPEQEMNRLQGLVNTKHADAFEAKLELSSQATKKRIKQIVDEATEAVESGRLTEEEAVKTAREKLSKEARDVALPDDVDPISFQRSFDEKANKKGTKENKEVDELIKANTSESLRELAEAEGVKHSGRATDKRIAQRIAANRAMKKADEGRGAPSYKSPEEAFKRVFSSDPENISVARPDVAREASSVITKYDPDYENTFIPLYNTASEEIEVMRAGAELDEADRAFLDEYDQVNKVFDDTKTAINEYYVCAIGQ